jgi:diguanylate cyclase (GGDEF)-like protein/PAS domain S-box-containing protein
MDNNKFDKKTLIQMLENQESLNRQLLKDDKAENTLDFSWAGNLGRWYWHIPTNSLTFNPKKLTALGYKEKDIPDHPTYQLFTDKLHPDDYGSVMEAMRAHLRGDSPVYEAVYRIKTKAGVYKWYHDRGKITEYSKSGKPLFLAGIVFDVTKQKEMEEELRKKNNQLKTMSEQDGLTGIYNHKILVEGLWELSKTHSLQKKPLSIILFDLDDFKKINDKLGHVEGDNRLKAVADILNKNSRKDDMVGRYGGEEFMCILANTNREDATKIANRIKEEVKDTYEGEPLPLTISGGVHLYQGESVNEAINAADLNLYKAKSNGKNQIV